MADYNFKNHWNQKYQTTPDKDLGWYEDSPDKSLQLIKQCKLDKNAKILNVGAGTTKLVDELVKAGYHNLWANDLSEVALEKLQNRIQKQYNYNLECIVDDLTQPSKLHDLKNIDLWIDRAVLHFFLEKEHQDVYFNLIKKTVAIDGYVLIAVFSLEGAPKCCNLSLKRYNTMMLQEHLGQDFKLITHSKYIYVNPRGEERPYIYTLFQRK